MEFELAQAAAERLGVGVRTVQKWAKEGKLPGAIKVGRDWQIPIGVAGPNDMTDADTKDTILSLRMPMPLLNSAFPVGECRAYIETIKDPDERNLALGEYYYFSGHAETAAKITGSFLDHTDPMIRHSAEFINGLANLSCNHMHLARFSIGLMKNQMVDEDLVDKSIEAKAWGLYTLLSGKVLFHMQVPEIPNLEEYLCYLPEGYRIFACYLLAHKAYLEKDYGRCLGIADTALAISRNVYPIPLIHIHIIAAVALMNLMRIEEAKKRFMKAWKLAQPDHLIGLFVTYHGMLQGLIEVMLKKDYPEEYQEIIDKAQQFRIGWSKIRNREMAPDAADSLNTIEFTVAMLYNRGWTVKEIAAHMELSDRTVNNRIQVIYAKLGITSKKELGQFMLR